MSINWDKHKFEIEKLAKQGENDKLIKTLCEYFSSEIQKVMKNLDKKSDDYSYYKNLLKAINKVQKQFDKDDALVK